MKKIIERVVLLLLVFAAVAAGVFWKQNQTEETDRINMEDATLPVVYMIAEGERMNCLHGYVEVMDAASMRDTLTPIRNDRKLTVEVDTYGNSVTELSYEIRSLDQTRLIEKTTVADWSVSEDKLTAVLNIENLIEAGQEYSLILHVTTEMQENISYYTRIIEGPENIREKLTFVTEFSEKTFDKAAAEDIVKYLESGSQGDNTNFGLVNIYSSFDQITWGNLEPVRTGEPQIAILEINDDITSVQLSYQVQAENMYGTTETYDVTEFFRTRYTTDRTFLLTYERTMKQEFLPVSENISGSRINLGIQQGTETAMESGADGDVTAFVSNGELWYYRSGINTMRCIFSFHDAQDDGVRTDYMEHDIEIVRTEANGDVYFLVHGYMNRGLHEGKVGMALYRYSYEENIAEELLYISYDKSADYLEQNLGDLFTITGESSFAFILEGKFYTVDFVSHEYTTQITGLKAGEYVISPSGNILAWQEGGERYQAKTIHVLLLDENREFTISKEDENLQVIGFIDEDLVYGVAKAEDIQRTATGQTSCYMSYLYITDKEEKQVGEYHKDGYYFTEAAITSDNMITLTQFQKLEDGSYVKAEEEYITNNASANTKTLSVSQVASELKKKELGITLINNVGTVSLKTGYINEIQSTGEGNLSLEFEEEPLYHYYVYAKGGLAAAYDNMHEAISLAYNEAGSIIDQNGKYVWKRSNTDEAVTLSNVSIMVSEKPELNLCLEAMLRTAGIPIDTQPLTDGGATVLEILDEQVSGGGLDLTGCSLRQVLYFVRTGRPVLGKLADGYVLIVGYDSYNAVLLEPRTGETYKVGLSDGTAEFEESGNEFVTYYQVP